MKNIILGLLLNLLFFTPLNAMTVEEAYKAIPHRQTTYDLNLATMDYEEALYLEKLFSLVDQAMLQRVQTLIWFKSKGELGSQYENYKGRVDVLMVKLSELDPPEKLISIHILITDAVIEQSKYFKVSQILKNKGILFRLNAKHASIIKSNRYLVRAYNELIRKYPNENKHNRQAFFDHLCALDFI